MLNISNGTRRPGLAQTVSIGRSRVDVQVLSAHVKESAIRSSQDSGFAYHVAEASLGTIPVRVRTLKVCSSAETSHYVLVIAAIWCCGIRDNPQALGYDWPLYDAAHTMRRFHVLCAWCQFATAVDLVTSSSGLRTCLTALQQTWPRISDCMTSPCQLVKALD